MSEAAKLLIGLAVLVVCVLVVFRRLPGVSPRLERLRRTSRVVYYVVVGVLLGLVLGLCYAFVSQKAAIAIAILAVLYWLFRRTIPWGAAAMGRLKKSQPLLYDTALVAIAAGVIVLSWLFVSDTLGKVLLGVAIIYTAARIGVWLYGVSVKGFWITVAAVVVLLSVFVSPKVAVAVAIVLLGYLFTMKAVPWVFTRVGRLLGYRMRVTPLTERRIQRFKRIRRGYTCFVIVVTAFVMSLFLELYVNDKPLYIRYDGALSRPVQASAGGPPLFSGTLWSGDAFKVEAAAGEAFEGDVVLRVDGQEFATIPVSCAPEIAVGSRFGPFEVTGGASTEGGELATAGGCQGALTRVDLRFDLPNEGARLFPAVTDWLGWIPFLDLTEQSRAVGGDFGLEGRGEVPYRSYARWARDPQELEKDAQKKETEILEDEARFRGKMAEIAKEKGATYDMSEPLPDWKLQQYEGLRARATNLRRLQKEFEAGKAGILLTLHPYSPQEQLLELPGSPPHAAFSGAPVPILGSDFEGKEVLSQLLYGFRLSFAFAFLVAVIGFSIGIAVGAVMGYYGGWTDILTQRFIEVWSSIPFLFTLMILGSFISPSFFLLAILLVGLRAWLGITYTIRGEYYREKARDYVQAARAIGVRNPKIMARHIFPNALVPVVTFMPFAIVSYITVLVSLDYLGFGLPPMTPSWGNLLKQGGENIANYPELVLYPILALAATLFCVVMVGEAVREAFDPKLYSRLR